MIPSNSDNATQERDTLWKQISASELVRIDRACDQFEEASRLDSTVRIETFIVDLTPFQQRLVVCELIEIECQLLAAKGLQPDASEYARRFPLWADEVRKIVQDWQASADMANPTCPAMATTSATHGDTAPSSHAFPPLNFDPLASRGQLGNYELQEEIGRGGMGVVYRARDTKLERDIALKILRPEAYPGGDAKLRFLREAKAAASVRHPNVVTIYGVEEFDGIACIIMEFVNGETLENYLRRQGPLPANEVIQLGLQITSGLSAAHAQGLIHRDIKPDNILLERTRPQGSTEDESWQLQVKLTDFGLARAALDANRTHPSILVGTPQYMNPEQVHGKECDHRSDLFSLGAVLFRMCTGQVAFPGESVASILNQIAESPPKPVRDVCPAVPPQLAAVIECLLAKAPENRFQRTADVEHAFRQLRDLSVLPESLSIQSGIEPSRRFSNGTLTALAFLGTLLLLLGASFFFINSKAQSNLVAEGIAPSETVNETVPDATDHLTNVSSTANLPADLRTHPLFSEQFCWSTPQELGRLVNTSADEQHPTITGDGLNLIFLRDGRIYQAKRRRLGAVFNSVEELTGPISQFPRINSPCLSEDGLLLFFAWEDTSEAAEQNLWICSRESLAKPFSNPVKVDSNINTKHHESTPCLSHDKLQLWFCTMRTGESEGMDLYYSTRKSLNDRFSKPIRLEGKINGAGFDFFPRLTLADRVLFYTTTSPGRQQIRFSTRDSQGLFTKSLELPPEINLGVVGSSAVTADGQVLIYDSKKPGRHQNFDLWLTRRIPKHP